MEFDRHTFDFSDTEVYFSSCGTWASFENPSDAAIARLSTRKGFTLDAVQAVLELIVFNPLFDSREVTFTSAGNVDETVAEYREEQVLGRASVEGEETAPTSGATSPLAISLVVSHIEQDMSPLSEVIKDWKLPHLDFRLLWNVRYMSLVHRSWTVPAQELLFRRILSYHYHYQAIRNLFQSPFCSVIRELHFAARYTADDGLHLFVLLLRRLPSLRKLSIRAQEAKEYRKVDNYNLWAKIYSEISSRFPNLAELWIHHKKVTHLEDCVKCILQGGGGAAPFVLKGLSIFDRDGFTSEMLLSPANVDPIIRRETPHYPSTYSSPQARNSGKISKCSITVCTPGEHQLGSLLARLFDAGGVFEDVYPHINHFTLHHIQRGPPMADTDPFFASFLGRCTSMTHMNVFVYADEISNQEMTNVPFSNISKSLQVLSVYYPLPVDTKAQERASGLERIVRAMHDREAGSSLERIEVTFCLELDRNLGAKPVIVLQTSRLKSIEMAPPEYLDPVRRMCHKQGINLVCKIAE